MGVHLPPTKDDFTVYLVEEIKTNTFLDAVSLAYASASFFFMAITTIFVGLLYAGGGQKVATFQVDELNAKIQDLEAKFAAIEHQVSPVAPTPEAYLFDPDTGEPLTGAGAPAAGQMSDPGYGKTDEGEKEPEPEPEPGCFS